MQIIVYNSRTKSFSSLMQLNNRYHSFEEVFKHYNFDTPKWWYDLIKFNTLTSKYCYISEINSPGLLAYKFEQLETELGYVSELPILYCGDDEIIYDFNSKKFRTNQESLKSPKNYLIRYYRLMLKDINKNWDKENYDQVKKALDITIGSKLP